MNHNTKFLLSLADIWLFQLIVDAISSEIETEKVVGSLKEDTFLEESLFIVIFGTVDILESEPIFFSSLSPENKAKVLEETFLKTEEVETFFEEHLVM